MTDPVTIGQPGTPYLAVDVLPDAAAGAFLVDVSEVDSADLLGWGPDDWTNIICDVQQVAGHRGVSRLQGPLTRAEAGTITVTLEDIERRFDPTANADVLHKGTPVRVRAWGYRLALEAVEEARNLVTNPRGVTPNTATAERRRNLWTNPAFVSTGTAVTGTGSGTTGAVTRTYTTPGTGVGHPVATARQIAAAGLGTTTADQAGDFVADIAATPGTVLSLSIYARRVSGSTTKAVRLRIDWLTAANAQVGGGAVSVTTGALTDTTVRRLSGVSTAAPANTAKGRVYVLGEGTGTGIAEAFTFDYTALLVEAASTVGSYFDGSTPDTETQDYYWNGAAHAALSSVASAYVEVRRNLIANPSSEFVTPFSNVGAGNVARSTVRAYAGTACSTLTSIAAGTSAAGLPVVDGLTAGRPYTLTAYVWGDVSRSVRLDLRFQTPAGATVGSDVLGATVTAIMTGWTRVTVTGTVPATADRVFPIVRVLGGVASGEVTYWDAFLLEQASVAGPYFDGATTDAAPYVYEWAGAAHASASVQRSRMPTGWTATNGSATSDLPAQASNGVLARPRAASGGASWTVTGLTIGQSYTVIAEVAGYLATARPALFVIGMTGEVTAPAAAPGATVTVRRTFTATATSHQLAVATLADAYATVPFIVTALATVAGNYSGPYFDGDTADEPAEAGSLSYAWIGSAHASASAQSVQVLVDELWEATLFTGELDEPRVTYRKTGPPLVTFTAVDVIGPLAAWESEGRAEPGVGAGDTLLGRVERVIAECGVGTVAADSDVAYAATLAPSQLAAPWADMTAAAEAELGRVWVDAAGQLVVRARDSELTGPVRGTLSDIHGEAPLGVHCCVAEDGAVVVHGPEQLANRALAARRVPRDPGVPDPAPAALVRVDDVGSQALYGVATVNAQNLDLETDSQVEDWAQTVVTEGGTPQLRVEQINPAPSAVDLESALQAWPAVCATDIGDRWLFRFRPEVGPEVSRSLGVLGIDLNLTPDDWSITWTTTDAPEPGAANPSGWFLLDLSEVGGEDVLALFPGPPPAGAVFPA